MKIIFLSHMFPNPVNPLAGTFVLDLARFINKKQSVIVVSPIPAFPGMGKTKKYQGYDLIPHKTNIEGLQIFYPRIFMIPKFVLWTQGFFYAFWGWRFIKPYVKACDIIVAHWTFPDAFAGVIWAKFLKKKIILVVHGNESICYYDKPSIKKWLIGKTIDNIDHIVAVSKDLTNKIISTRNVNEKLVSVIPNGVDYEKFPHISQYNARKKLSIFQSKKILLTVARLSHEKALDILLKAIVKTKNLPEFVLYIIGDGPEKSKLNDFIVDNHLQDKVVLMGGVPHDKIHLWMSAADIFLLPSLREGTPVVIGEAFACGTPVIASSVGGIPDLIINRKLGILIKPNSVPSLLNALEVGLKRVWDRDYIGDFGSRFSWENIAKKTIKVISEL